MQKLMQQRSTLCNTLNLALLWLVLLAPLCWAQPTAPVSSSSAVASSDFEHYKELQQKDAAATSSRFDAQDKRIDAQNNRIGDISGSVDRFGIIVTVLLAVGGLFGYFSVVAKAKNEANETAQSWFTDKAEQLEDEIEKLRAQADAASTVIKGTVARVQAVSDDAESIITAATAVARNNKLDKQGESSSMSAHDADILKAGDKALQDKPENSYSFDDWNIRALVAYDDKKYALAAEYWQRAADIPNAGVLNVAKVLFNKAICLAALGKSSEAMEVYDALIASYAADPVMREPVAKAMVNKGFSLGALGKSAEEIEMYDTLISSYAADPAPAMREQVAKAMFNKGVCFGALGKSTEAIAVYDALITRYAADPTPAIRDLVAAAKNGIGFNSLCTAKEIWSREPERRKTLLVDASTLFAESVQVLSDSAIVLGNQAYAAWLQGDAVEAELKFKAALNAENNGGQVIYDGALGDLDIHPVPEDAGFKLMIERLWLEYQQSNTPAK